jgi:hypothetical protein
VALDNAHRNAAADYPSSGNTGRQYLAPRRGAAVGGPYWPSSRSAMMSLMYANIMMGWYLMLLNAPWLFMQAMMKGLEGERASSPARTVQ